MNLSMLIDARNLLYKAIFAVKASNQANKYHYMVVVLRQLTSLIRLHNPTSIHIFWDAPRDEVWRRSVLNTYKDRNKNNYVENISEDLKNTTLIAEELFAVLNMRQYSKKQMEADDLIYAATTVIHPNKSIIISSDSDLVQIPFVYSSSSIYDPGKSSMVTIPPNHPAMLKALMGDKTDTIDGYLGIGPKKGNLLLESQRNLQDFLNMRGRDIYQRNLLLTDLSLCPRLLSNKLYIQKVLSQDIVYDKTKINEISRKYKLYGLDAEYANLIPPFNKLT